MARVSKAAVIAELENQSSTKKLIISGSSISTAGRVTTLMKIRPSLMRRVEELCLGPTYLLLELALEELCESLEAAPPKFKRSLPASSFDPSEEDIAEVEAMHARREAEGRQVNRRKTKVVPDLAPSEKEE